MKNQTSFLNFGFHEKISVYIFMFQPLCSFSVFKNSFVSNFCRRLNFYLVSELFWLQGDAFAAEGFVAWACGRPYYSGRSVGLILVMKGGGIQWKYI